MEDFQLFHNWLDDDLKEDENKPMATNFNSPKSSSLVGWAKYFLEENEKQEDLKFFSLTIFDLKFMEYCDSGVFNNK